MNILSFISDFTAECREMIDDIDRGGCGVMAVLIHKLLSEAEIPAEIRVKKAFYEEQLDVATEGERTGWSYNVCDDWTIVFHHFIVKTTDPVSGEAVYIDSRGVSYDDSIEETLHTGSVPYDFTEVLAFECDDQWCEQFDRAQIPYMLKLQSKYAQMITGQLQQAA